MSVQLKVRPGDRVKVVIPAENLKCDCDKVYPNGGTGTVIDFVDRGTNHGCVNFQGMAYVQLDKAFKRTALLERFGSDTSDTGKKKEPKFRIMNKMWIPTWLLEAEKGGEDGSHKRVANH